MRGVLITSLVFLIGCAEAPPSVVESASFAQILRNDTSLEPGDVPGYGVVPNSALGNFGNPARGAGDVNGDGYADVVVSDGEFGDTAGPARAVFLFYGSPDGVHSDADWMSVGADDRGYAGYPAGDINGDGFSDLAIGQWAAPGGGVELFLGGPDGPAETPDWSWIWTTDGPAEGDGLGTGVEAGDFNGDGYSDLVVAASGAWGPDGDDQGGCFVFYGAADGLTSTVPDTSLWGAGSGDDFCQRIANAGDVDGNGSDDLLVSRLYELTDASFDGPGDADVWLFDGSPSGLATTANWVITATGNDNVGESLDAAGDVDGDGFADFLLGDGNGTSYYGFQLHYGGASGPTDSAWFLRDHGWTAWSGKLSGLGDINGDGYADFAVGNHNRQYVRVWYGRPDRLVDDQPWDVEFTPLGTDDLIQVGPAGDTDGDGFGDILWSTYDANDLTPNGGAVYVSRGRASARSTVPVWSIEGGLSGFDDGDAFGAAIAADGDVNGDGFDDVLVGAPCDGANEEGAVTLHFGSAEGVDSPADWSLVGTEGDGCSLGWSVALPGDTDGDGYGDVLVGCRRCGPAAEGSWKLFAGSATGPSTTPLLEVVGDQAGAQLGESVEGAGDVNGDGYADIIAGSPMFDGSDANVGRAQVWFGGPGGPSGTPDWSWSASLLGARFGFSVSGARDVNDDGYSDVIVGAPNDADTLLDEGKVYVFFGSPTGPSLSPDWQAAGAESGALFGSSVSWAGDMDHDGFDDLVVGAPSRDALAVDGGAVLLFLGGDPPPSAPVIEWGEPDPGGERGYRVSGVGDNDGDIWPAIVDATPYDGATQVGSAVETEYIDEDGAQARWLPGYYIHSMVLGDVSAGDVDGDGFADVVVGAPGGSGDVHVFPANHDEAGARPAWSPAVRLTNTDDTPISPGGHSSDPFTLRVAMAAGSPYGRTRGTLDVEFKPRGVPFDAADLVHDPSTWVVLGCPNCLFDAVRDLAHTVTDLEHETEYRWRARVRYDPARNHPVGWSPWQYGGLSGDWDGIHVRTPTADLDGDGWAEPDGDCNDDDPTIHPTAAEVCDAVDQNCDGVADEGFDIDGDSVTSCGPDGAMATADDDCNDGDPSAYPAAVEVCDGDLEACGGVVDAGFDVDGDGFFAGDGCSSAYADIDCGDDDAAIHPGATELCDSVDSNCDGGLVDTWPDFDLDGQPDCIDPDVDGDGDPSSTDCDDYDPARYTNAQESCDSIDSDCDSDLVDGDTDTDQDGLPDCVDGDDDGDGSLDGDDCGPVNPTVYPGATEFCDDVDSDCDGDLADTFVDTDADGLPNCVDTDDDGDGYEPLADCDDLDSTVHPDAIEACNGEDDDCDGVVPDDELDDDGDVYTECEGDCDDGDPARNPGESEICNDVDDDCSGAADDGLLYVDWYADGDGDGYGVTPHPGNPLCAGPDGYSDEDGDCEDGDAAVHPGAAEVCNEADDDCDTEVDEDLALVDHYRDDDGDGFGNPDSPHPDNPLCAQPAEYVTDATDCDDSDPATHPGAVEVEGNAADENCDGVATNPPADPTPTPAPEDVPVLAPGIACGVAGSGVAPGWLLFGIVLVHGRRRRRAKSKALNRSRQSLPAARASSSAASSSAAN